MRVKKVYPNLQTGDQINISTNSGTDWSKVIYQSQTDEMIIVHEPIQDSYIEIHKNAITELFNSTKQIAVPLYELTRNVPFDRYRMFEFINKEHESNYIQLLKKWSKAEQDKEYTAAVYILALPIIFEKFEYIYENFQSPVAWIADYEYKYNDNAANHYELSQAERDAIIINYDLTSSMIHLGRLALHLFNGYKEFHMLNCISNLDIDHYYAFTQAITIRK